MSPQLDSWQRDREKQGVQWDWSRRIKSSFWVSKKCFCVALGVCAWVCVGVCLTDWLGGIGWSMRWQEICSLLSTEKDWHFSTRDSFQFLNSQTYTTWMKPCSHPNITHKQTFLSHHSRKIMCVFNSRIYRGHSDSSIINVADCPPGHFLKTVVVLLGSWRY